MYRATVGSLVLLAALLPAPRLLAHTALSVDAEALWRVDLDTLTGELLVDLSGPSALYRCHHLAVSSTGLIRCALGGSVFAIDRASGEVTELPPPLPIPPMPPPPTSGGLAFDGADRLWYIDQTTSVLLQLDPATGAVLTSQPLSLTGAFSDALAALGDRLHAFTRETVTISLEEIDPATGTSLSAVGLDLGQAFDAAFDASGDLWVVTEAAIPAPGGFSSFRVDRITLATANVEPVSSHSVFVGEPAFANIADVRGTTVLEIPTLGHAGRLCLLGLLLVSALGVLQRTAR